MAINANQVKELREKTGAGMMDCKNALHESSGDMELAIVWLRKKGLASAQKKATRIAAEGMIGHYIHPGDKLGVLVEMNCETDFAAKSSDFQQLVKDIAMHIAAQNPLYVRRDEVPAEVLEKEKEIYKDQARASGKPDHIIDKIAEGKLESYYQMACLYDQQFVKDPSQTVEQLIGALVAKIGENIKIRRFARFKTGEGLEKRVTDLAAEVQAARRRKTLTTTGNMEPKYKRVLLKLSGEVLVGEQDFGIDAEVVRRIAAEIRDVYTLGVEIGIVIGGGNIFRGLAASAHGFDRVSADHMGMLATVINSLALQDALEKMDVFTRVQTAIEMNQVAEMFIRRRAIRHLEKNRVVIFAAGTGNPYFSTDTTAALRAMEIKAEVILKATKVDGIYTADPVKFKDATLYSEITYLEVLKQGLGVMDATAISLCMDNHVPIIVFNIKEKGNIKRVIEGEKLGSLVY